MMKGHKIKLGLLLIIGLCFINQPIQSANAMAETDKSVEISSIHPSTIYVTRQQTYEATSVPRQIWASEIRGVAIYGGYIPRVSVVYHHHNDTATATFAGYIKRSGHQVTLIDVIENN